MTASPRRVRGTLESFLSLDRNVLTLSLTALLINFGAQAFQPFIPLFLESLNANIPEIGIVYVGIALATNLVSIPGGFLADRVGRKAVIVLGNALGYGLFLVLLIAENWVAALAVLFVSTIFTTLVQPAYSSTVAESVETKRRGGAFGTFFVLVYLGLALGSVVGGYLPNPGRYEFNILVVGLAGVAAALGRFLFLKETLARDRRSGYGFQKKRFLLTRLSKNVWLVLIALLIYNFFSGLGQPLYAIFTTQQLSLSQSQFAVMIGVGYLASMLGALGVGKVSKKLGVRNMMIVTIVIAAIFLLPWLYSPDVYVAIGLFAISGFFVQFYFIGNQTLMANITKSEERSSIIGLIITIAGFGSIVAPYVGSQLWVTVNPRFPFLISILLAGTVAIPLWFVNEPPADSN